MKALFDLRVLVSAVDLGSLSAAARALGISPAVASAALKRLEEDVGARLLLRSTRSLRPTPAGERFLAHAREAVRALEDAGHALRDESEALRGELRISAPSDFGRHRLLPWLDDFQRRHPALRLRLLLSDRIADVQRLPIEVAVRYGALPDSSLVALPLVPDNRRVVCAAPAYLARAGVPRTPADLAGHNCLRFVLGDEVNDLWRFHGADGELETVAVDGDRVSDDAEAVRRWALEGLGIASKSRLDVYDDLRAGRLVTLLPEWRGEPTPLHLVCADRRLLNPVVQRLRVFLAERCAAVLADERPAAV
jgi:DNA-binding transcriptional LysR family regulator